MNSLTISGKGVVNIAFQLVSSSIALVAVISGLLFPDLQITILFTANWYLFTLVLVGLNTLLFFNKTPKMQFVLFIPSIFAIGTFLIVAIGYICSLSRLPLYSSLAPLALIVLNIGLTITNQEKGKELHVLFRKEDRLIIVLVAVYFIFRLMMLTDAFLYLDDQLYFRSALRFLADQPSLAEQINSAYFGKYVDWVYPFGFPILIGTVIKGASIVSTAQATAAILSPTLPSTLAAGIMVAKGYLLIFNSFLIFPLYLLFHKLTDNNKITLMLAIIVAFNQWNLIESPYLLVDTTYTFFFAFSIYFFFAYLESDGEPKWNLMLSIITCTTAFFLRPNGVVQAFILLFIIAVVYISKSERIRKVFSNTRFSVFHAADQRPDAKSAVKSLFVVLLFVFVFYFIQQVEYFYRNGISIFQFITKFERYAYFREGNVGQFTPVDFFSISWFFERLGINLSFFINTFTQLTGFIPGFPGLDGAKQGVNLVISVTLFLIAVVGLVYYWIKHGKTKPFTALFHACLLLGTFLPVIMWGETYAVLHRLSTPLLVLVVPSMYLLLQDVVQWICRHARRERLAPRIITVVTTIFVVGVLYSAFGFMFPLIFQKGVVNLVDFIKWQFYDIPMT